MYSVRTSFVVIAALAWQAGCQSVSSQSADSSAVVDAGSDQRVAPGAVVVLDGSRSRAAATGQPLRWRQVSGASVELTDPEAAVTSFVAPAARERETMRFKLVLGGIHPVSDDVEVTVDPEAEEPVEEMPEAPPPEAIDEPVEPEEPAEPTAPPIPPLLPEDPVVSGEWMPPIGIPAPPFGVLEEAPAAPDPWDSPVEGFYYVDNTHPKATDHGNPYGWPAIPRQTIPYDPPLPAGSVVKVQGGPYRYGSGFVRILAAGTADRPVFVSGVGMPRFDTKMSVFSGGRFASSYLVIEGFDLPRAEIVAPAHHVSLRYCDVHGDVAGGGVAVASYSSAYSLNDIVVYANRVHDNGDWHAEFDQDVHGITVTARVSHTWILDNEIFHNSGDGVQINAGSRADQASTHHIYVGRNHAWENKQTGFWTKQAVDVIFSQNTANGHYPVGECPSAWGAGMGYQSGPERVWFLDNHIYDCAYGIQAMSTSGLGTGLECFIVGNLIHDIHHHPDYSYEPGSSWSNAAMMLVGTPTHWVVNNTIYNVDAGINGPYPSTYHLANNIIANVSDPEGHHVFLQSAGAPATSSLRNTLLDPAGRIRWGSTKVYDLNELERAFPHSTTGCISAPPMLMDPPGGDFRPQPESPAVDRAEPTLVYERFQALYGLNISKDANLSARPQGESLDIGAFEKLEAPDTPTSDLGSGE